MRHSRIKRTQRGATLIEILVATFVAAIGVMGLSKYQLQSLIQAQATEDTSMVTWQLYSMAERIRSNPVALADGQYLKKGKNKNCHEEACSPKEMAEHDIWLWEQENKDLFVKAKSEIEQPGGAGNPYEITIMWDGRRSNAKGKGCDPTNPEDLVCSSILLEVN